MPALCDFERELLRQLRITKAVPAAYSGAVSQGLEVLHKGGYIEPDPTKLFTRSVRLTEKGVEALRPRAIPDMP